MRNILVIVPTLNEKNNIIILLKKLKLTKILHDILFIDDNSKDGSQEVIKKIAKKNRNINYIFRPKKLGIGSAHKEGFVWSYKKKYKISQIPIQLPYRKLGSSKMQIKDMIFSLYYLMIVFDKKFFGQYNFQ